MAAKPRGRAPGFVMDDSHRVKIQNSNILNALIEHVVGKREMSATQVSAGVALMKKVLPDLSAVTLSGPGDNGEHTVIFSAADILRARLDAIASRTTGAPE